MNLLDHEAKKSLEKNYLQKVLKNDISNIDFICVNFIRYFFLYFLVDTSKTYNVRKEA